jgi:hypothetical protein
MVLSSFSSQKSIQREGCEGRSRKPASNVPHMKEEQSDRDQSEPVLTEAPSIREEKSVTEVCMLNSCFACRGKGMVISRKVLRCP